MSNTTMPVRSRSLMRPTHADHLLRDDHGLLMPVVGAVQVTLVRSNASGSAILLSTEVNAESGSLSPPAFCPGGSFTFQGQFIWNLAERPRAARVETR